MYAIGFWAMRNIPSAPSKALEIIAQRTGGIAFFPEDAGRSGRNQPHRSRSDIRNQYAIGYKPTIPKEAGNFRQIRVEAKAKGHGKLMVRTKSGYYAGAQPAAGGSK